MTRISRWSMVVCLGLLSSLGAQAQWCIGASVGGDYNWYAINTNYQTDYRYDGAWK